jgi:hypothetical protein
MMVLGDKMSVNKKDKKRDKNKGGWYGVVDEAQRQLLAARVHVENLRASIRAAKENIKRNVPFPHSATK